MLTKRSTSKHLRPVFLLIWISRITYMSNVVSAANMVHSVAVNKHDWQELPASHYMLPRQYRNLGIFYQGETARTRIMVNKMISGAEKEYVKQTIYYRRSPSSKIIHNRPVKTTFNALISIHPSDYQVSLWKLDLLVAVQQKEQEQNSPQKRSTQIGGCQFSIIWQSWLTPCPSRPKSSQYRSYLDGALSSSKLVLDFLFSGCLVTFFCLETMLWWETFIF